jgi:hypothetical protein
MPNSSETAGPLNGVSCVGTKFCLAVGGADVGSGSHVTLTDEWTAGKWSAPSSADPSPNKYGTYLSAVACTATNFCLEVGGYGIITTGPNTAPNMDPYTLKWNGTNSSTVDPTPIPPGAAYGTALAGVSCAARTLCRTVGYFENKNANQTLLISGP